MTVTLTDALLIALATGAVSGLIAWGGVRVQLRYMNRDIAAAHQRLDKIGAPAAWVSPESAD